MSFDWRTEEEGDWAEETWEKTQPTAVSAPRPWRTIMLVLVLLSVAGVILLQQINKRFDETTAAIESDIFAAHNLLSRAAANRDGALGKSVLSGRDRGWSNVQTERLDTGLFYQNPGLFLTLDDAEVASAPLSREDDRFIDLALEPNLNGATLHYTRDVAAFTDQGVETVTLQQTAVYRRGETRWLYAPPLAEFWGDWQTLEHGPVTFIFPQRDEILVEQLANDLSSLLEETCRTLAELNCSEQPSIQLRFDTDPESLLAIADPANLYGGNLRLNFPTPTLVGLPFDESGYQALFHGYGANLISALIGQSVAYECCRHAPMYQAVLTYQLSELGLVEWPVTRETHAALATGGAFTEMLFPYWGSTEFSRLQDENSWRLYGFVEFLFHSYLPERSPLDLLAKMNTSVLYQTWLINLSEEDVVGRFGPVDRISREWWFYAMTQAEETAVSNPPEFAPQQDLQLGCLSSDFVADNFELPQMSLTRYQFDSDTWQEEVFYPGLAFFNPLPQDDGIVLQLAEASEDRPWQTLLWRNGASAELMDPEDLYSISLGQVDPNGRYLVYYSGVAAFDNDLPASRLMDLGSCSDGRCESLPLGFTPYWSPDGNQTLLSDLHLFEGWHFLTDGRIYTLNQFVQTDGFGIWLSDAIGSPEASVKVGEGLAPFWISNELFGFIETPIESLPAAMLSQALVVVSGDSLEREIIVRTADLQSLLPEDFGRLPLSMRYAIPNPANPDQVLLLASAQSEEGYLFQVDLGTRSVELLLALDLSQGEHSLGFSPDGRFVVVTGSWRPKTGNPRQEAPFVVLQLYDLQTGEQQSIVTNNEMFLPAFNFDWSQDGRWLAFLRDKNTIGLLAPALGYEQTLLHDLGQCSSLAWINPLPDED